MYRKVVRCLYILLQLGWGLKVAGLTSGGELGLACGGEFKLAGSMERTTAGELTVELGL